jgi:CRP/FNR family transcriptional regulator, cyclic AMP receptor protein
VHNRSGERRQGSPSGCRLHDGVPSDLDQFAVEIELPSKTLAFTENDPADAVFAVCAGKLRLLSTSREGRTAILRMSGPGDFLGLSSVLNEGTYQVTAETVAPTLLKRVQRLDFLALLQISPQVSRRAAEVLARQCNDLILDARRLALSSSVSARLARFLLEWDHSPRDATQDFATAALTHEEIASMTGTSRETVTRLLKRFERDGVIVRHGSSVVIANRESLYRIAG